MSEGLIPYPIHLEKLVQILHYWVKDPSFLHLLRLFLHEYWNLNSLIIPKKSISFFCKKESKILLLLNIPHQFVMYGW
ncbi:hypothetical protein NC653_031928 [Populus alba x Populus x berolinensis]|uniref:Maturase MatK N-terminal domain-containing protein n=1 Tax=Populus alba x Populus x berolinensis TaxID=444605 RepID=A0AAD6M0Q3_9ROSI|nr:hypothetical protein NC653_031928 [Populus alba x Populus x berolinensis]